MPIAPVTQIRQALKTLNPEHVRELAEKPVTVGVLAADDVFAADVFSALVPADLSQERSREAGKRILRIAEQALTGPQLGPWAPMAMSLMPSPLISPRLATERPS